MSQETTSYLDWLVDRLKRSGLRRAFGVPGGGTSLDLMLALRDQGIEPIVTAREDAAVIMAGVSGILNDGPGLAYTTKGPGLANATNGLASAALDRLPALIVCEVFGEKELEFLSHQVFEQGKLIEPLLQKGWGKTLPATQDAVERWLGQPARVPAVMFSSSPQFMAEVPNASEMEANEELYIPDLTKAEKLLGEAGSPVIVIGLEAARTNCVAELRNFINKLGAPVLCTYMAKGCLSDDDPHFAGLFTGGAIEQSCMNNADLIVLVGLDPVELIRQPWTYKAQVLDVCERLYDPHYLNPAERIIAPLSNTLNALAEVARRSSWTTENITDLKAYFIKGMEQGGVQGLSSSSIVKAVRDSFSELPRLTVDAGAHMFSACAFWPANMPNDLMISNGLASMGFAVPAGIAAALHDPERGAVAMTGDGGFLMCMGELKTAAETSANIMIIVFNDGRLSLIDVKREDRQMPDLGLSWSPPDFATAAKGFGFRSWLVDDAAELRTALDEAADTKGPRLLDIRVDISGYQKQLHALRG